MFFSTTTAVLLLYRRTLIIKLGEFSSVKRHNFEIGSFSRGSGDRPFQALLLLSSRYDCDPYCGGGMCILLGAWELYLVAEGIDCSRCWQ